MLLRDLRTSIELVVNGYQFPDIGSDDQPEDPESWDSNWLIIHGTVTTGEGSPWSFQQPCLTTWEVAELADWFQNVAAGLTPPLPPEAREPDKASSYAPAGWLTFTEPNLSFGVGAQSEARVQLLICLSHELAQPPLDVQRPTTSRITIETTPQQTQDAAAALQEYLATFPAR
ncbi:hypothetical protein V3G39_13385 [Dermatophilaceae bacterium Sec6.4]